MGRKLEALKSMKTAMNIELGKFMCGGLSSLDKGDRRAVLIGGALGGVLAAAPVYASIQDDLGLAEPAQNIYDFIFWGITVVGAIVLLGRFFQLMISGEQESNTVWKIIKRIIVVLMAANFVVKGVTWVQGLGGGDNDFSTLTNPGGVTPTTPNP